MRATTTNAGRSTPKAGNGAAPPDASELLDVPAAAAHLGVNETFIRRLVLEKRVRYYKVGKFVRFRPADLDAFVAAGAVDPADTRGQLRRRPFA